jgi:hypothetical protein
MIVSAIAVNVGSSLIMGAINGGSSGQQAQQMVDPFASYRPQYASQLNSLMQNPNSVQQLPGWQAQMDQGTQAIQRQQASMGGTQSGAEQMALQTFAGGQQNQFFQQQLGNLSTLSGAGTAPTAGGQAGVAAANLASTTASGNIGGLANILSKSGVTNGSVAQQPAAPIDQGTWVPVPFQLQTSTAGSGNGYVGGSF